MASTDEGLKDLLQRMKRAAITGREANVLIKRGDLVRLLDVLMQSVNETAEAIKRADTATMLAQGMRKAHDEAPTIAYQAIKVSEDGKEWRVSDAQHTNAAMLDVLRESGFEITELIAR